MMLTIRILLAWRAKVTLRSIQLVKMVILNACAVDFIVSDATIIVAAVSSIAFIKDLMFFRVPLVAFAAFALVFEDVMPFADRGAFNAEEE